MMVSSMELTAKNIRTLLHNVRLKWYDIGIELGFSKADLDEIKVRSDDPAACLYELINQWLKTINPDPLWSTLVDALRAPPVDEQKLAAEVECKSGLVQSETAEAQAEPSPKGNGLPSDEHIIKAIPIWKIRKIEEIQTHSSFHGMINAGEAEESLKKQGKETCFLTRYSECLDEYLLSVLRSKEDEHIFVTFNILITKEDDEEHATLKIEGADQKFESIADLLGSYKSKPLNHTIDCIGDEVTRPDDAGKDYKRSLSNNSPSAKSENASKNSPATTDQASKEKCGGKEGLNTAVPQWAMQVMKDPSFYGSITKMEAIIKLFEFGRDCYLTRYSSYRKICVLSVLKVSHNGELVQHFKLDVPQALDADKKTCRVAGTGMEFEDVSHLLQYYQKNPLFHENDFLGECLQSNIWKSIDNSTENEVDETEVESEEINRQELRYPTYSNLRSISYMDEKSAVHHFKLAEQVADKWWKAGMLISLSKATLDKYRDTEESNTKSCERVFRKWIKNNGHQDYPLTWAGLHTLLIDMGRRTAAEKLFAILRNDETDGEADAMYWF